MAVPFRLPGLRLDTGMTKIGCIQEAARAVVFPNLGLPAVCGWVGAVTLATKFRPYRQAIAWDRFGQALTDRGKSGKPTRALSSVNAVMVVRSTRYAAGASLAAASTVRLPATRIRQALGCALRD